MTGKNHRLNSRYVDFNNYSFQESKSSEQLWNQNGPYRHNKLHLAKPTSNRLTLQIQSSKFPNGFPPYPQVISAFIIYTLPETNIATENRPLEKEIPIENHHF